MNSTNWMLLLLSNECAVIINGDKHSGTVAFASCNTALSVTIFYKQLRSVKTHSPIATHIAFFYLLPYFFQLTVQQGASMLVYGLTDMR